MTRGFAIVSRYKGLGINLPKRKTGSSAGYDIEAAVDIKLPPHRMALVPTGVKAYMQPDEVLCIHIRSGISIKHQLMLMNSTGIIDADYYDNPDTEGELFIAFYNCGDEPFQITKGMRIAQGIFMKYLPADGDVAGQGAKRSGGFGSTGVN